MPRAYILMLPLPRQAKSSLDNAFRACCGDQLLARRFFDRQFHSSLDHCRVDAEARKHGRGKATLAPKQPQQKVVWIDGALATLLGFFLSHRQRLLGADAEPVEGISALS